MRVLAGLLVATFATFTGVFSHVLAGGALPSWAAIALSLALSIPLCVALAGRAQSLWRTAAAVAASQAIFHLLFSGISSSGTVSMSAHVGHEGASVPLTEAGSTVGASGGHDAAMWCAHAVAAVLTVIALRYTEVALLRLRETAHLFLGSLTIFPAVVSLLGETRSPRIGCATKVLVRDLALLFATVQHRGPPALSAA
jgi:hypothetical protein